MNNIQRDLQYVYKQLEKSFTKVTKTKHLSYTVELKMESWSDTIAMYKVYVNNNNGHKSALFVEQEEDESTKEFIARFKREIKEHFKV